MWRGTTVPTAKKAVQDGVRDKTVVTLVGEAQASVGFKFVASVPPDMCRQCRLFLACMGKLVPGRAYEVMELKDKEHYCELYEGKVRVARVMQTPIEILIKPQHAIEGATMVYAGIECDLKRCPMESSCQPEGVKKGEKVKIIGTPADISVQVPCRKKLRKATVLVVDPSS
jgi:uncharacterized protein (UPF0179 family)